MSGRSGAGTVSATGGRSAPAIEFGSAFVDGSFSAAPREKVRPHPPGQKLLLAVRAVHGLSVPNGAGLWSGIRTGDRGMRSGNRPVLAEAKPGRRSSGDAGPGGGTLAVAGPAVRRRAVAVRHALVRTEPHPDGGHGGLGAVGDAELAEDRRQVGLD